MFGIFSERLHVGDKKPVPVYAFKFPAQEKGHK